MRRVPEWLWAPLSGADLVLVIGCIGYLARKPWLFPSLGPTVFLQEMEPQHPSSQPYHILMGHAIGIVAAALGVGLFAAESTPPVMIAHLLSPERIAASTVALALMLLGQVLAKAPHPPAAATALRITLGGFKLAWWDMGVLAVGIVLTTVFGEGMRRLRQHLAQQHERHCHRGCGDAFGTQEVRDHHRRRRFRRKQPYAERGGDDADRVPHQDVVRL